MSGVVESKQTFVQLSLPRIEALLRGKHPPDELEKLVAAMLYNMGHADSYEITDYLTRMCRRAAVLVQQNITVPPALFARFLTEGVKLLGHVGTLATPNLAVHRMDDMLGNGINRIFGALDEIFDFAYRYRLYTIHPSERFYRGLMSISMPADYEVEFDVRTPDRFGKTKAIPFTEPPYELVPQTHCHALSASALENVSPDNRAWYTDRLRLGDTERGVPRTYTWELTRHGPADRLCLHADANQQADYAIALSLDAGDQRRPYSDRILGDAELHLLDELLLSPFGSAFADYFFQLRSALESESMGSSTEFLSPEVLEDFFIHAEHRQIGSVERLAPWVYAAGDPVAERIGRDVEELKDADKFVQIIGPSGVGKQRIAEALHYTGKRREGNLIVETTAKLVDGGVGHQLLTGSEEKVYTDVGRVESIFEKGDGGTVILDEFYRVPPADRDKHLLTIVGNLGAKPRHGWYRSGSDEEVCPDVRILLTGNPSGGEERIGDMQRRFPGFIRVPGWYELNAASRVAIIRWFMVRQMKARGVPSAEISRELLGFLVNSGNRITEVPAGNMSFIENWLDSACAVIANRLQFTLAALKVEMHPDAAAKAAALLGQGPETFTSLLFIGAGSCFPEQLDGIADLAYTVASSHLLTPGCTGCVDPDTARAVLDAIPDQGGAFTAYYLLLAASNMSVAYVKNENADDKYRTAPEPVKSHFGTLRTHFTEWFQSRTRFQPNDMRSSNRSQYGGWSPFQRHLQENAAEISQMTFAIQRALPAFPDFPYWSGWFSHAKERNNGKAPANRKPRSKKQPLPLDQ